MPLRTVLVTVSVAALLCAPAAASQPDGLAGEIILDANSSDASCTGLPGVSGVTYEWYEYFSAHTMEDPVTLAMAIIPLVSGDTSVSMDEATFGGSFVGFTFSNGLVNSLPYNRYTWNDVTVTLRPGTQDYTMTVNGVHGGPFPFGEFCAHQGGCSTVQAFRLNGTSTEGGSATWIDSVSIFSETEAQYTLLMENNFNGCQRPSIRGAGLVIAEPPARVRRR